MPEIAIILIPAVTWDEPFNPDEEHRIFNAHRPLNGHRTWESTGRWGVHYAMVHPAEDNAEQLVELNRRNDAREVCLVTNLECVELYEAVDSPWRGRYSLQQYVEAGEDVSTAMAVMGLPWHAEDRTADQYVADLKANLD